MEKRVSQQSLLDQGKHLQKRIDNLDAQLKNANLAKQMAVAEAQKQAHDERDRAYSGQQPQSQADEPAAKRQKIETESQETEIKKLKSQIKYLERKAHCLGSEVDAKDEVVATFRDESEAKSRENDRLKGEIETMKLAVAELERELRQLKKSRDVLTESLNASTTMSETALAVGNLSYILPGLILCDGIFTWGVCRIAGRPCFGQKYPKPHSQTKPKA